ncbi:hypothetical protein ACQ4M4_27740 [Leptolyngbya sp. AN02str]|uniref:hypothetical protein n=1 Tax=Leptolyngbya sp. AN02str TaxID=3423363 RepID=UPI003D311963
MAAQLNSTHPSSQQDPVEIALPLVVDESVVHRFSFWNGTVQQGIRYRNKLYIYFEAYALRDRLKAYEIAYEQAEQGIADELMVCVTVSKTHYTIWLSLKITHSDKNFESLSIHPTNPPNS